MRRKQNFQRRIFSFYSILLSGILTILCTLFFIYIFGILRSSSETYFKQVVGKVTTNLDNMVLTLDVVSTQLIASSDLQNAFIEAGLDRREGGNYFDDHLQEKRKALDILVAINSAKDRVKRLSLFDKTGTFVSLGNEGGDSDRIRRGVSLDLWYSGIDGKSSFYKLLPPHRDDWASDGQASLVVSLVRPFIATYASFETLGAIEIQQSYSRLAEICRIDGVAPNLRLFVIDGGKKVVYPYGGIEAAEAAAFLDGARKENPGSIYSFKNEAAGRVEYASFATAKNSDWTVIIAQPRSDFMRPAYGILRYLVLIWLAFVLLALLAVFLVTRALTTPIRELRETVKSITLEDPNIRLSTSHDEIELLKDAFNDMLARLKLSANELIQAKAGEGRAHFLALQAQINPHFLYNSIMSISAAGQEAGSEKVQIMCAQLGDLLRYVASMNGDRTTIKDELGHVETYLKFVKWRYEDLLDFSIDVPSEMQSFAIPKLLFQPIIENCFSHGFKRVRPPYAVSIKGSYDGDAWTVDIRDNGQGFNKDALELLDRQFARIEENINAGRMFDETEIGGMALNNIYNRLKLLYKESAFFRIENPAGGGSRVSIGGPVLR